MFFTWPVYITPVVALLLVGWFNVAFYSNIMAPVLNDVATDQQSSGVCEQAQSESFTAVVQS
jgi:hypothetical protein